MYPRSVDLLVRDVLLYGDLIHDREHQYKTHFFRHRAYDYEGYFIRIIHRDGEVVKVIVEKVEEVKQ